MRIVFRCDPAIENELIRLAAARAALPDWLRAMPWTAFSDLRGQEVRTVKQCPPFVDAMSHGFVIPLPCDVTVRDGVLSWDWDHPALTVEAHPRSPVSFHVPAQVLGTPLYDPEVAIVKFNSFWTIELEPGHSLFATHPVNRADLPSRLLTGVVDCDRFTAVGVGDADDRRLLTHKGLNRVDPLRLRDEISHSDLDAFVGRHRAPSPARSPLRRV